MDGRAYAQFLGELQNGVQTVLQYEDELLQALALSVIPEERLRADAAEAAEISALLGEHPTRAEEDALAEGLLAWFKQDFFAWVNSPPCERCGAQTSFLGGGQPTPQELSDDAQRVELHRCGTCQQITRFPRYNSPSMLLQTRKGRCGEFANCFTLCCRAVGLDARYVRDWADHVWTEYYSHAEERWIHMDSCETAYDKPLLYEVGWGKQLNYVVGFSKDGVVDVSKRYTKDWPAMAVRRTLLPEAAVVQTCRDMTAVLRDGRPGADVVRLAQRDSTEQASLEAGVRDPLSAEDLTLPGRQTGSADWRSARGESGSAANPPPTTLNATRYRRTGDQLGAFVRASGENPPGELAVNVFDGRPGSKWLDFGGGNGGTAWLEYRLPPTAPPLMISHYQIMSAEDAPERDPRHFLLEGVLETRQGDSPEPTWVALDEQREVMFEGRHQLKLFRVANPKPCRQYRLLIRSVRDPSRANSVQIAQLHFTPMEAFPSAPETPSAPLMRDTCATESLIETAGHLSACLPALSLHTPTVAASKAQSDQTGAMGAAMPKSPCPHAPASTASAAPARQPESALNAATENPTDMSASSIRAGGSTADFAAAAIASGATPGLRTGSPTLTGAAGVGPGTEPPVPRKAEGPVGGEKQGPRGKGFSKEELATKIKQEFARLMSKGDLTPNEAAALAVKAVTQQI